MESMSIWNKKHFISAVSELSHPINRVSLFPGWRFFLRERFFPPGINNLHPA